MKAPSWVWLVGLGGAAYVLYKVSDTFRKGVSIVTQPVSDAIADYTIRNDPYLSQPTVQSTLTGSVLFPSGALVPVSKLSVKPYNGPNGFEARVTYNGTVYRLAPHDANGNYPAVPT